MTREEAIAYFKKNAIRIKGIMAEEDEALKDRFSQTLEATEMAIKALEQLPKLQNRCFALTHGQICMFCPCDCENRTTKYRSEE